MTDVPTPKNVEVKQKTEWPTEPTKKALHDIKVTSTYGKMCVSDK